MELLNFKFHQRQQIEIIMVYNMNIHLNLIVKHLLVNKSWFYH